jgi:hypothetical protein
VNGWVFRRIDASLVLSRINLTNLLSTACHVFDSNGHNVARKSSKHVRIHRKSFRVPYPFVTPPSSLDSLQSTLDHLREAEKASIYGFVDRQSEPRLNQGQLDQRPAWNRENNVQYFPFPCFVLIVMYTSISLLVLSNVFISSATLEYPEGFGPGDELLGTSAEFFRYRSVFVRAPNDEDRAESLRLSQHVLCDVCETVLSRVLKNVNFRDEDAVLDALEGINIHERPFRDPQMERIRIGKRGCQRHFKDSLMAHGFRLSHTECTPPDRKFCLFQGSPRDSDDMDTYTRDNEALFFACEQTVGAHIDQIAKYVNSLTRISTDTFSIICRKISKCAKQQTTSTLHDL